MAKSVLVTEGLSRCIKLVSSLFRIWTPLFLRAAYSLTTGVSIFCRATRAIILIIRSFRYSSELSPWRSRFRVRRWITFAGSKCCPYLACRARLVLFHDAFHFSLTLRLLHELSEAKTFFSTHHCVRCHEWGMSADSATRLLVCRLWWRREDLVNYCLLLVSVFAVELLQCPLNAELTFTALDVL